MKRSASFSPDGLKRFDLVRDWSGESKFSRVVNFIGLNPSKAGAVEDDMTVRKGIGFATRWGYNGIVFTNLSAVVSTDPWDLPPWNGPDPENTAALLKWMNRGALLVAAWGSQPRGVERVIAMPELIHHVRTLAGAADLYCIGETGRGSPAHPSRAAYTAAPVLWREAL